MTGPRVRERPHARCVTVAPRNPISLLTPRQVEVVRAVVELGSIPRAAAALFISPQSVKNHLTESYRKAGIAVGNGKIGRVAYLLGRWDQMREGR